MPELPEVETSVQAIQEFRNQNIESIKIFNPNLRWKVNRKAFQKLHGKKVKNISRTCLAAGSLFMAALRSE